MKFATIFCLLIVVLAVLQTTYAADCQVGDVKQENCNTCRCVAGGWACTRKQCIGNIKKRAAKKICEPNKQFKKDCNTCTCNASGTNAICTLRGCL